MNIVKFYEISEHFFLNFHFHRFVWLCCLLQAIFNHKSYLNFKKKTFLIWDYKVSFFSQKTSYLLKVYDCIGEQPMSWVSKAAALSRCCLINTLFPSVSRVLLLNTPIFPRCCLCTTLSSTLLSQLHSYNNKQEDKKKKIIHKLSSCKSCQLFLDLIIACISEVYWAPGLKRPWWSFVFAFIIN